MRYKTINADTLLKKITRTDNLFNGGYTVDPYQNCEIGCIYCDSSFEKTVFIKNNAVEILEEELKKNEDKGRIIIGSVHDPYQPVEKEYNLTRNILKKIKDYCYPCHILTKSDLVLRDLDIIRDMDCLVTLSISSLREDVVNIFEPDAINPFKRLGIIKKISEGNVKTGLAVIPFFPFIMDDELENIVRYASVNKADYVLFKVLELKGNLKKNVFEKIQMFFSDFIKDYRCLYDDSYLPKEDYVKKVGKQFSGYIKKYGLKKEIIEK